VKKIKHNDLTHYFLRQHSELPRAYLASCKKFFNSLKPQAPSSKLQASSAKLAIEETQSETIKNLESIINEIK
jgi:hypothetical protein